MKIARVSETDLIVRIQKRFGNKKPQCGIEIGDDAAAVQNESDKLLLLATDILVEGNHFIRGQISFEDLGYKAMAVNLSDIAAMGGTPAYVLISLGLPPDLKLAEFDQLYDGIQEAALKYGVKVVGGDITSSKFGMVINVSITGYADKGKVISQDGAKPGDLIAVTGKLGGSLAGLLTLMNPNLELDPDIRAKALDKHYRPTPRVKEGVLLAATGKIHAMKDISDGLAKEINTIANTSGVKAVVDAAKIPVSPFAEEIARLLNKDPLEMAIQGGEEYELLFTFASKDYNLLNELANRHKISMHLIGQIEEGDGVLIEASDKIEPLHFKGYQHF